MRWYDDAIIGPYGDMMIWWYDGKMIWWHDDMVIRWYDDRMIWWYDDMMVWWYDDLKPPLAKKRRTRATWHWGYFVWTSNRSIRSVGGSFNRIDRSVRSVGGWFDRIDRSLRSVFDGGRIKKQIRDVEICQLSNFQPPTTFGGRKTEIEIFVIFGSVGSVSLSVRSVSRRWDFEDRRGGVAEPYSSFHNKRYDW